MVIYFYCHVATKIQSRVKKVSFLCDTNKIISFFAYIQITQWQHVDLLRIGPRKRETFNQSFTHLLA